MKLLTMLLNFIKYNNKTYNQMGSDTNFIKTIDYLKKQKLAQPEKPDQE